MKKDGETARNESERESVRERDGERLKDRL